MVFIIINIYIYIWCHILPQKNDLWYHICPPEKRVWVTQFARRLFIFRCCKFQRRQGYSPRFVTIWRRQDLYLVSVLLGEGGFADLFPTLNWVHPWKLSGWKIWHFLPTWSLFWDMFIFRGFHKIKRKQQAVWRWKWIERFLETLWNEDRFWCFFSDLAVGL